MVCKDDSGYITQLKQQKIKKVIFLLMCDAATVVLTDRFKL